jgi:hypothetical protein
MRPAPDGIYDVPIFVDKAKVHPDHHIEVARALYSVPNLYLRKHVRVRADRKVVKIYFGTELIKMHERQPPGRTGDRSLGLPGRKGHLRNARRRRSPRESEGPRRAYRHLRGAAARWSIAVEQDAAGVCAHLAL